MNLYSDNLPIIACCSGTQSNSAIAIIRLSGFESLKQLKNFFTIDLCKVKPRYCHLTDLKFDGSLIDNVLITFFPEGKSFTGENVLEIHAHGNILNVNRIVELFISIAGFRHALPGEFSYRALKNKKLSFSQVEGLDLMLNATSNLMLTQGIDILQGQLHENYLKLYKLFINMNSAIELLIDFSDDVGEEQARKLYFEAYNAFKLIIDELHQRSQGKISSLLNPEIAIVGQTNAGKSSLFNILLSQNRSIVSSIAGTTRDYVSDTIYIDGTHYSLIDTAGLRESNDEIEKIGIERAMAIFNRSFYKILVIDPFSFDENYPEEFMNNSVDLLIISHADKEGFEEVMNKFSLEKFKYKNIFYSSFKSGSIGPVEPKSGSIGPVEPKSGSIGPVGPKSGSIGPVGPISGPIGPVGPHIKQLVSIKFQEFTQNSPILLDRHTQLINKIHLGLSDKSRDFKCLDDLAIASDNVRFIASLTSELIGFVTPDDVLNSVFSNFCIGK